MSYAPVGARSGSCVKLPRRAPPDQAGVRADRSRLHSVRSRVETPELLAARSVDSCARATLLRAAAERKTRMSYSQPFKVDNASGRVEVAGTALARVRVTSTRGASSSSDLHLDVDPVRWSPPPPEWLPVEARAHIEECARRLWSSSSRGPSGTTSST